MGARINYTLTAGQPWQVTAQYTDVNDLPVNLTGWAAAMDVRRGRGTRWARLLRLTSPDGGITITPTTGTVTARLTGAQTATLAGQVAHADFDLVLAVPGGSDTVSLVAGTFTFRGRTTADA